jgi:hypothetical protein
LQEESERLKNFTQQLTNSYKVVNMYYKFKQQLEED